MKRQIKFRAKQKYTDEWVSGSLLHYNLDYFFGLDDSLTTYEFCYIWLENAKKGGRRVEVDKNTIGQFTGLYDNDGKEIYEGDIVVFGSPSDDAFDDCPFEVADSNPAYEVKWFDGRYIIRSKFDDADELCDNLCGVGPGSVGVTADCVRKHFLVIGNIYDNPDLIKREDDRNRT